MRMPRGFERWHGGHDLHFISFSCSHRQPLLGSVWRPVPQACALFLALTWEPTPHGTLYGTWQDWPAAAPPAADLRMAMSCCRVISKTENFHERLALGNGVQDGSHWHASSSPPASKGTRVLRGRQTSAPPFAQPQVKRWGALDASLQYYLYL